MEKLYLSKEARKAIEQAMPSGIRKAYKSGQDVELEIVREKPMYRWGRKIKLRISRCGMYVWSDKEDETDIRNIAENVVGYFVYGDRGIMHEWKTKGWLENGHYGAITHMYVTGGNYAIKF